MSLTRVYSGNWGDGYKCDVCYGAVAASRFEIYSCGHGACSACHRRMLQGNQHTEDHCYICKACRCETSLLLKDVAREKLDKDGMCVTSCPKASVVVVEIANQAH